MTKSYIKNVGRTKTTVRTGKKSSVNTIDWDLDYNGKQANISLDVYDNHNREHYDFKLDNDDLDQLFNIPSVDKGLEDRLIDDFKKNTQQTDTPFAYLEPHKRNHDFKTHLSSPIVGKDILQANIIDNRHAISVKPHTRNKRAYSVRGGRHRRDKSKSRRNSTKRRR